MKADEPNRLEVSLAYIHGRLEAQIELFATALGVPAVELARRMGTLLSRPASGQILGIDDRMPGLPAAPAEASLRPGALALARRTPSPRASGRIAEPEPAAPEPKKQPDRRRAGWGKFKTEKARTDESIRRMRKRADPTAKRILKGLLRKKRALAKAA